MCGIVGYVGKQVPTEILFQGLKKLEYRGYDSAGISIVQQGEIHTKRCQGKLSQLAVELKDPLFKPSPADGTYIGIGHTRWATHGKPSKENAHPHQAGPIAVVHNGIIENYIPLREKLLNKGYELASETDTEIVAYLIYDYSKEEQDLEKAVVRAIKELRGTYSLGVISQREPQRLVAVKNGTPLIVGLGTNENFIASDIHALLEHTKRCIYLEDHEIAVLNVDGVVVKDRNQKIVKKKIQEINWSADVAEKQGYQHFMLKEIHEQPNAIIQTLQDRITRNREELFLEELRLSKEEIQNIRKIFLVACGTAYHASLIGKYWIESMAKIPCEVDIASEFRYRAPLIGKEDLLIVTSQSGETADSLAALREAKKHGAKAIAICNVRGSSIDREADFTVYTHAGPEIGVASTKAFTTQLVVFNLIAIHFGLILKRLPGNQAAVYRDDILRLPHYVEDVLGRETEIKKIAQKFYRKKTFLYLGRGPNFPVALEGALKLKEISYIHAEGYAAGEMKHGPIALVDEDTPVIILAPQDAYYEKVISNLEEIRAREGIVIAIGTEGDEHLPKRVDAFIAVPKKSENIMPILLTIPIQLIAYHIALKKGTDIDQPRNLAKSVTVE